MGQMRAEIRRLFNWLKQKGLTTVITAERDQPDRLTRHGMLGGKGFYRGSSILASGTAGTGKTTVAACCVDAACRRGERSS